MTSNNDIVKWVTKEWRYFSGQHEFLIKHLINSNERPEGDKYFMLQLARLVTIPDQAGKYASFDKSC